MNNDNKKIIQQIAQNLGFENVSKENQEELVTALLRNVSGRVSIAILDGLSQEDRIKFRDILESESKEAALNFLNKKNQNLPEIIKKIAEEEVALLKML